MNLNDTQLSLLIENDPGGIAELFRLHREKLPQTPGGRAAAVVRLCATNPQFYAALETYLNRLADGFANFSLQSGRTAGGNMIGGARPAPALSTPDMPKGPMIGGPGPAKIKLKPLLQQAVPALASAVKAAAPAQISLAAAPVAVSANPGTTLAQKLAAGGLKLPGLAQAQQAAINAGTAPEGGFSQDVRPWYQKTWAKVAAGVVAVVVLAGVAIKFVK